MVALTSSACLLDLVHAGLPLLAQAGLQPISPSLHPSPMVALLAPLSPGPLPPWTLTPEPWKRPALAVPWMMVQEPRLLAQVLVILQGHFQELQQEYLALLLVPYPYQVFQESELLECLLLQVADLQPS